MCKRARACASVVVAVVVAAGVVLVADRLSRKWGREPPPPAYVHVHTIEQCPVCTRVCVCVWCHAARRKSGLSAENPLRCGASTAGGVRRQNILGTLPSIIIKMPRIYK